MKTLISANQAYSVFAEIITPVAPENLVQLKFSTKFADAKNPDEYHDKFSMMLSLQELRGLESMLMAYTQHDTIL